MVIMRNDACDLLANASEWKEHDGEFTSRRSVHAIRCDEAGSMKQARPERSDRHGEHNHSRVYEWRSEDLDGFTSELIYDREGHLVGVDYRPSDRAIQRRDH